jgi:hypothetical protein
VSLYFDAGVSHYRKEVIRLTGLAEHMSVTTQIDVPTEATLSDLERMLLDLIRRDLRKLRARDRQAHTFYIIRPEDEDLISIFERLRGYAHISYLKPKDAELLESDEQLKMLIQVACRNLDVDCCYVGMHPNDAACKIYRIRC